MRRVTINNSLQKARDTSRIYELLLFDDDKQTIVSENDNVTVKIGNRTGFLLDIEPGIANGAITIDSTKFSDLPADDYRLEVWMYRNEKLYIYPDEKQITLRLSSTLNDITGTMLSTITIEQLRKEIAESSGAGVPVVGPKGEKVGKHGIVRDEKVHLEVVQELIAKMYNVCKSLHKLGLSIKRFVKMGSITADQYETITGKKYE